MGNRFMEIVTTESVLRAQKHYFGRSRAASEWTSRSESLTQEETDFIEARDSFYMATVTETGWPYVQHRGGKPGFLKVVNPSQLAFADYTGNRQLLSTGNLAHDDRVTLFLMDYPNRERLKIMGHARVEDAREHPDLVARFAEPEVQRIVERIFLIDLVSFDWNCPKYITPRYTAAEIEAAIAPLKQRIAELEAALNAKN